jgi:hypothetical protein
MPTAWARQACFPDRQINAGSLTQINTTHHASGVCFDLSDETVNSQLTTVNVAVFSTIPAIARTAVARQPGEAWTA